MSKNKRKGQEIPVDLTESKSKKITTLEDYVDRETELREKKAELEKELEELVEEYSFLKDEHLSMVKDEYRKVSKIRKGMLVKFKTVKLLKIQSEDKELFTVEIARNEYTFRLAFRLPLEGMPTITCFDLDGYGKAKTGNTPFCNPVWSHVFDFSSTRNLKECFGLVEYQVNQVFIRELYELLKIHNELCVSQYEIPIHDWYSRYSSSFSSDFFVSLHY